MRLDPAGLHWRLKSNLVFLNHGSFGAVPLELEQERRRWLDLIEQDPVAFLVEQLPIELERTREVLACYLGATAEAQRGLAFVPSTTYGLNELISQWQLPIGSKILLGMDAYNATVNIVEFWAQQRGWQVLRAQWPLPLHALDELLEAYRKELNKGVAICIFDHISSPTAMWQPLEQLISLANSYGARVVIDGAHGPGSVPINLSTFAALGMEAYVGNLHKWLCCPKGSAFLWVADSIRNQLRPLVISHGANAPNGNQGRFRLEHDWIGTQDPSAILCLPKALQLLNLTNPEDQKQLLANRREVLLPARLALIDALQQKPLRETITPLFPDEFIASMVSVDLGRCDPEASYMYFYQAGFQIPVIPLKPHSNPERSFLRLSWFSYNTSSDLELLLKVCSCFNLR